MRIISGKLKGKKILLPTDNITRPLRDMVKESIFNILKHSSLLSFEIKNSFILDLFCGTGSFGLECISRGASHVTFFDNHDKILNILDKNIKNLDCLPNTKVFKKNIFNNDFKILGKYDLIFLDPPFDCVNIGDLILKCKSLNILKKNGLIILHRKRNVQDIFPLNFKIIKEKKYGISKILFGN